MAAYVILTVFLFQRGSAESKDPDKAEPAEPDARAHQETPAPGRYTRAGSLSHSMNILFAHGVHY